ncbi:ABC transporter ATP-binding protein [Streptosporangium carneum]|uniref:ABC transporter ATP-binding protein n=1 Tax=Streptosporangium carneum TaxID=47481 RepID=A0A9W6MAJ9_9ACTN|nr:ABC transporter ATP-binding protein [Streptosporangium carneum]GLK07077.1 ABC transporter ATP-binding protein [Streptosporangium carneum]
MTIPATAAPAQGAAPAAAAITLKGVSKTFPGGMRALEGVDLTVPAGEFVAILGPSGCGKSTLLRIVADLMEADPGGSVEVDTPKELGVVFQTSNLLPWLTVEGNLTLGARLRGVPKADIAARVGPMLETLGLESFARKHPHELSGGMRQRAALGQTLICRPKTVLLDEPFGALDALTRDRLNVELLRLWQDLRQTVLLVTHSIPEAVFLADRVIVMSGRPGAIAEDLRIDIPRPRDPAETRALPEFTEAAQHLRKLMGVV